MPQEHNSFTVDLSGSSEENELATVNDSDEVEVEGDPDDSPSGDPNSEQQEPSLASLGVEFMEQDFLERKVAKTADKAMLTREVELDEKRLDKTNEKLQRFQSKLRNLKAKVDDRNTRISERGRIELQIENLMKHDISPLLKDIKEIKDRLKISQSKAEIANSNEQSIDDSVRQLPTETTDEFLIRTGQRTAFGSANGFIQDNDDNTTNAPTHQNLISPGLVGLINDDDGEIIDDKNYDYAVIEETPKPAFKKRKTRNLDDHEAVNFDSDNEYLVETDANSSSEADIDEDEDANFIVSDGEEVIGKKGKTKTKKPTTKLEDPDEFKNIDDGDESTYQARLKQWSTKRSSLRAQNRPEYQDDPLVEEWKKPHPTTNDAVLNDEFKIPGDIYPSLFDYQKTCVQWLWELYSQKTGGIIGDEMGLGKTVQVISFLAGLHYSGKLDKPVLVVCPATVLKQWCNEFHRWWPVMRTIILHSIGTGMSNKKTKNSLNDEESLEELLEQEEYNSGKSPAMVNSDKNVKQLVDRIVSKGHVIITTYAGARIYAKHLLPVKWGYVVLDEGHKIRNPDSYITLTCKQFKTPNRVILSGTPIQNNLVELWSLFDFVFPGRLGTLPVFQRQFCVPINLGGYSNATNVQVQTSYKCAVILRDLIAPYLLRRLKADVAKDLPKKSEMVLFCKLTPQQRTLYENFLASEDVSKIVKGSRNALYGIDILRKICNHPDLVDLSVKGKLKINGKSSKIEERSGKLQVVSALLESWINEGRKTLVFTQTRQMLQILQEFMDAKNSEKGNKYKYLRMDGSTPISLRQTLVDQFNQDPEYPVFLLTTRVGGLGVNLTGASRVIIYDPDWNPSTDLQARERAWRLGQKKDVTIYRLMIAGSIEEKIYHRQIFKQLLTNKILKDPKQKRFFKMNDLYDLFTLGEQDTKGTETADLFNTEEKSYNGTLERESKFKSSRRPRIRIPQLNSKDDDDLIQVSQIKGVESLQEFEDSSNRSNKDDSNTDVEDSDLMSGLLKSAGVHSSLEHDKLMDASKSDAVSSSTHFSLIDREATRIANDAVKALRESRKETRKTKVGVPTWTGKFGQAGKFTDRTISKRIVGGGISNNGSMSLSRSPTPGATPSASSLISSSSILEGIKNKKRGPSKKISPVNGEPPNETKLITKLSEYMSGLSGFFATSGEVLDNLKVDVNNEKTVKVIRSMLKSICTWDRERKGWTLNEEFR